MADLIGHPPLSCRASATFSGPRRHASTSCPTLSVMADPLHVMPDSIGHPPLSCRANATFSGPRRHAPTSCPTLSVMPDSIGHPPLSFRGSAASRDIRPWSLSQDSTSAPCRLSVKTADLRTKPVKLSMPSVYRAILRTGTPKSRISCASLAQSDVCPCCWTV